LAGSPIPHSLKLPVSQGQEPVPWKQHCLADSWNSSPAVTPAPPRQVPPPLATIRGHPGGAAPWLQMGHPAHICSCVRIPGSSRLGLAGVAGQGGLISAGRGFLRAGFPCPFQVLPLQGLDSGALAVCVRSFQVPGVSSPFPPTYTCGRTGAESGGPGHLPVEGCEWGREPCGPHLHLGQKDSSQSQAWGVPGMG
jgi:hypothetical protein